MVLAWMRSHTFPLAMSHHGMGLTLWNHFSKAPLLNTLVGFSFYPFNTIATHMTLQRGMKEGGPNHIYFALRHENHVLI